VSIVRLNYHLKGDLTHPDITWNFVDMGLWSVLEVNIAMICGKYREGAVMCECLPTPIACLPFLRPIFNKIPFSIAPGSSKPSHSSNFSRASYKTNSSNQWEEVGCHGSNSTTVQARGTNASNESLFGGVASGPPEPSTSSSKDDQGSVELGAVPPGVSKGSGIVVTRGVTMQRQSMERN
jgi:hypothetical protein